MGLSTNNLFHYTNHSALLGILSEGFRYRVTNEDLPIIDPDSLSPIAAIPGIIRHTFPWNIICFCDIPPDHISDHRLQYGDYALGLSKDWAIYNRVTPVRYVHYYTPYNLKLFDEAKNYLNYSARFGGLIPFITHVKKTYDTIPSDFNLEETLSTLPEPIQHILAELESSLVETWKLLFLSGGYLRAYKGDWVNRVEPNEVSEKIFYDEKEWRSVSFDRNPSNLRFKWKDVSHIIIPQDTDRSDLIEHITKLKTELEIEELESIHNKIFTYDDDLHDA